MAQWEKLKADYYQFMDNFSDAQWDKWMDERMAKKEMRRLELSIRAKIQEYKISTREDAILLFSDKIFPQGLNVPQKNLIVTRVEPQESGYALAA